MKNKKIFYISLIIIVLMGVATIGAVGYNFLFNVNFSTPNNEKCLIFITENTTFSAFADTLSAKGYLKNRKSFENYAKMRGLENKIKVGCYTVKSGMTNRDFFNIVCNGWQTPVKLTFNNVRFKENLCSKISKQVNIDSAELYNYLNDSVFLEQYGFTPQTVLAMFIPNTYEVYWTISPYQFFERINKEYSKFWNETRTEKAAEIPLSRLDVAVLASIVDEETNKKSEKPIIAGLYINRLKKGMKLQACPTARYAAGDFTITQVLDFHTNIDSPYNTYKYHGLPPAPIRMPSIEGIDAVLNYAHHNHIFMCAKPELNGKHAFAATLGEHEKNVKAYYRAYREWKKNQD
ncbi:MAG: endolytic transglycosylase MltG [Prevotellaceae bacterium]|jgi:UPF0755 protein|nr:endolytic transglycosylase MltG [Prevotellaceae bacterium]